MNIEITPELAAAFGVIAAAFAGGADAPTTAPSVEAVTPPKVDGRNKAARKHNHEARIARRTSTVKAHQHSGRGMTKDEKSDLYRALVAANGGNKPSQAAWGRACADFKAAN